MELIYSLVLLYIAFNLFHSFYKVLQSIECNYIKVTLFDLLFPISVSFIFLFILIGKLFKFFNKIIIFKGKDFDW